MELGLGIHGEPGAWRGPAQPADAVVSQVRRVRHAPELTRVLPAKVLSIVLSDVLACQASAMCLKRRMADITCTFFFPAK